jgi:hypothetical protein
VCNFFDKLGKPVSEVHCWTYILEMTGYLADATLSRGGNRPVACTRNIGLTRQGLKAALRRRSVKDSGCHLQAMTIGRNHDGNSSARINGGDDGTRTRDLCRDRTDKGVVAESGETRNDLPKN